MFNKKKVEERIGDIEKSTTLWHLKEVEKYFLMATKRKKIETAYDVIANELPYFKTLNYTEWAHCFIIHPLQQELRVQQMRDAYDDNVEQKHDFVEFFRDRIINGQSNKYAHIDTKSDPEEYRENLVVLVGSNKLKERIDINKLKWICDTYEDDVFFKPHPLTTHQLIGEMKDILGESIILNRDADMYKYLLKAETVFTSHLSESAVYAVCLDKRIEPTDVYYKEEQGSFFHINHFLFRHSDPKEWINRTMNSPKCGIINPILDENWKRTIDAYLDYIMDEREKYKDVYV